MSELSRLEKDCERKKKELHKLEADLFLDKFLHNDALGENGDYLLALGSNHSWGEAAVFRVRKKLWGKKSYQFGLFPQGRDHQIFVDTRSMAPICSVPWAFEKCDVYPCASRHSNEVNEWIKAESVIP